MKKLRASIVIPVYNGEAYISETLGSIVDNTDIPYELIAVDDGSTDKSPDIVRAFAKRYEHLTLLTHKENTGTASAINTGISRATTPYMVVLGQDMIVGKNWLFGVVAYLDTHPRVGGGQLKILRYGKNYFDSAGELLTPFGFLAERARGAIDHGQFDRCVPIFSGKGTATVFRKKTLVETGLFDESYRMYWEEPDIFWRIWKSGYRVEFLYMGKTWHKYLTHVKPFSPEQQIRATYFGCRNQITTMMKNAIGMRGCVMVASVITVWHILFVIFIMTFNIQRAYAVARAIWYVFQHAGSLYRSRKHVRNMLGEQYENDHVWMPEVTDTRGITWYVGKMIAYCLGKPY